MRTRLRGWFRRTRIVLDVLPLEFIATARRGSERLWEMHGGRDVSEPFAASLAAFLARMPSAGRMARAATLEVRLGPELAQVRCLRGLPETRVKATLTAVVREGAGRFFIGNDLVTSDVFERGPDAHWAASFPRSTVSAIVDAAQTAGLRLERIVPRESPELAAPLAKRDGGKVPARRMMLAAGTCVLAFAAASLAPALTSDRAAERARAELAALRSSADAALADRAALDKVTTALDEHATAVARRSSSIEFLARLTAALPPATALMMVRLDSAGGTIVAVGPRAAAVVSRLDSMPSVAEPGIVGPVTREVSAGNELERVTIRFARKAVP